MVGEQWVVREPFIHSFKIHFVYLSYVQDIVVTVLKQKSLFLCA